MSSFQKKAFRKQMTLDFNKLNNKLPETIMDDSENICSINVNLSNRVVMGGQDNSERIQLQTIQDQAPHTSRTVLNKKMDTPYRTFRSR